jgi:hypothetical protein
MVSTGNNPRGGLQQGQEMEGRPRETVGLKMSSTSKYMY